MAAPYFGQEDALCASKWWNPETNKVQRSGDSEHDVRMRVVQVMWKYQQLKSSDVDSDEEVDKSCHKSVGYSKDNEGLETHKNNPAEA